MLTNFGHVENCQTADCKNLALHPKKVRHLCPRIWADAYSLKVQRT